MRHKKDLALRSCHSVTATTHHAEDLSDNVPHGVSSWPDRRVRLCFSSSAPVLCAADRWRRSADCDDGNACTLDFFEDFQKNCNSISLKPSDPTCVGKAIRQSRATPLAQIEGISLTLAGRKGTITVAIKVLRDLHPHRLLHFKFLRVDVVRKLKWLQVQVVRAARFPHHFRPISTFEFQQRMIKIFNAIDDLHSTYRPPAPRNMSIAMILFAFRDAYSGAGSARVRSFVVSDVAVGAKFANPSFLLDLQLSSHQQNQFA